MGNFIIKQLTAEDWKIWKELRLEALKNSPESFGSSYEEEVNWSDLDFQNSLIKSDIFGLFVDNSLVSCAGFYSLNSAKTKHRGVIWGMYTQPEHRGQGIASALIQTIISHAKSHVAQLHLTCVTTNLGAVAFYQKHGFKIYGTEPRALKIRDKFFDEHLMILDLTGESMKQLDTYLSLCTQVYEISKPTAPEDALAFYTSYADEVSGAIFEPMCGTGCFLLPLAKDGYKIEGSDASEHMLDVLRSKAEQMSLKVNIWKSVASEIPDNKIYSLIFIPSGSFGLITESDEISKTLKSFYNHLDDSGILVFEVETKNAVPELGVWRGSKWLSPDGKMILLSSCASIDGDICSSVAKYELIDKNQVLQTEIEEYKIKIYEPGSLLELLKSIGFRDVKILKAFDRSNGPSDSDESIVYECRK